jgi:hypothetical protein
VLYLVLAYKLFLSSKESLLLELINYARVARVRVEVDFGNYSKSSTEKTKREA